jgi:hypothetical protein
MALILPTLGKRPQTCDGSAPAAGEHTSDRASSLLGAKLFQKRKGAIREISSASFMRAQAMKGEGSASLVMADSRAILDKDPSTVQMEDLSFIDVSALMNYRYAKKHGYNFAIYQMPSEQTCSHGSYGQRHPAWCKLMSLVDTQHRHPNAKYRALLDSDMFIGRQEVSIEKLLEAAVPEKPSERRRDGCFLGSLCNDENCSEDIQRGDAWLQTANGMGLLSAFVVLRSGKKGDEILKRIWNIGSGAMAEFNKGFPWEQAAWSHAYKQSLLQDRRIVGIGGLDASWTGHERPHRCNQWDGGIQLDVWSHHICHFEDDEFMLHKGSREARDRLRKLFNCESWSNKSELLPFTKKEQKKLAYHNLYAGNRHITFLQMLRDLKLTEEEFRELYKGAYNSKVRLSSADMTRLTKEVDASIPDDELGLLSEPEKSSDLLERAFMNHITKSVRIQNPLPEGKWRTMGALCEDLPAA